MARNLASCDICNLDSTAVTIYCFKRVSYCEEHYYLAKYAALALRTLCAQQSN